MASVELRDLKPLVIKYALKRKVRIAVKNVTRPFASMFIKEEATTE